MGLGRVWQKGCHLCGLPSPNPQFQSTHEKKHSSKLSRSQKKKKTRKVWKAHRLEEPKEMKNSGILDHFLGQEEDIGEKTSEIKKKIWSLGVNCYIHSVTQDQLWQMYYIMEAINDDSHLIEDQKLGVVDYWLSRGNSWWLISKGTWWGMGP